MPQSWVSIFGSVEIADGVITLIPIPLPPATPSASLATPYALVRSNLEFEQGTLELQVWLPDSESRCQIGLGGGTQGELYAGLNVASAPYGFAALRNGQWEPIFGASAGYGNRLQAEHWHRLRLHVQGSNLDLYFNDVKVTSASFPIARSQVSLLLQSSGRISVRDVRIKTQEPICFVVMQFTEDYNALYTDVIKPTCERFGYKVLRADDFYNSGMIIDDITNSIRECAIVIADVTPNNPNVFYEVGFAHGIGKPTILLSDKKRERLPFDISGFRTLFYDNTIGGKTTVEERLRQHLEAMSK